VSVTARRNRVKMVRRALRRGGVGPERGKRRRGLRMDHAGRAGQAHIPVRARVRRIHHHAHTAAPPALPSGDRSLSLRNSLRNAAAATIPGSSCWLVLLLRLEMPKLRFRYSSKNSYSCLFYVLLWSLNLRYKGDISSLNLLAS
jgi:hypothetical protein